MNQKANIVELVPAYCWTCPDCGIDKFERAICVEMCHDEREEMKTEMGIEHDGEGMFVQAPESVRCDKCGKTWGVTCPDVTIDLLHDEDGFDDDIDDVFEDDY